MEFRDLGITTDETLRELSKKLNIKVKYIGFAEDLLKEHKELPHGFSIFNLGDEKIGGTHWTCCYKGFTNIVKGEKFPKNGTYIMYFDSYGIGPEDAIVKDAANNNGNLIYNTKQLQKSDGVYCGVWCLLWMHHFDYHYPLESMKSFVDMYQKVSN